MQEKKHQIDKINKVSLPVISRLIVIFGIGIFFLQFLWIPVLAQSIEYYDGYNVISYDNGSKDIISGALNFLRWDGVWRPEDELNISNGSWPYSYSENAMTADFKVDDTTLSIPIAKTKFKLRKNSISYDMVYSKSELQEEQTSIDLTDAFIDIRYELRSNTPKNEYKDEYNIIHGRFQFKAGIEHISIHDDTPRNYEEDGKVFQDVTYLDNKDYDFRIVDGRITLKFNKKALEDLTGNVIIEIRTWDIIGPNNWGGNVTFSQTTDVKATGNAELKQTVTDYALYTRFDEGSGNITHNENTLNLVPAIGDLLGVVGTDTYTPGKFGQAIHFNGIDNKVLFNDHPDFRLPYDFTISYYIDLTSDVNNVDSDITRKGSTATANPDSWWKIELTNNLMHGSITKNGGNAVESYDTVDRRDGLWHFVAYTRGGTTCRLIVDGTTVKTTSKCPTNAVNTALLSIGSKDTYNQTSGLDFTHGTIDEVRIFNRNLSPLELTFIQNNAHYTTGTVTRNLVSIIQAGEEIKELGCYGIWDQSITKVNITASTDNINWDTIQPNAVPNHNYTVLTGNNYTYSGCSLSTTDPSKTPIIESIRARIGPKGLSYTISVSTSPPDLIPQPTGGDQYPPGQNATVTAQQVGGYSFQNWTEGGTQVSTSPAYEFTVTGDRNLVAEYTQNPVYTISLSTSPLDLSPSPTGGGQHPSGKTVTVTAQSVIGYTFQNWTEGGNQVSTNYTYQFTVTGDRNLVAEYTQDSTPVYTISVSTSPLGLSPQPAGGGQYLSGQTVTVTAQSVNNYTFQNWTENAILVSTNPIYQFMVTGDRNLVAEYTQNMGSLAGWWKFDNDMLDWSGNGNDGTCSGSGCPTSTIGKIAGALYFDGINDYINAGNRASLDITGSITIEAWIKPGRKNTSYIVKKASKGITNGYELSLSSAGKGFFRVNQRTSGDLYRVDTVSGYPVNNNTWVHLVGLYDGTQLKIYLNGNLDNSKPGPSNISSNTDNLEIGGPDSSTYYRGTIDEVRVWNRALSPEEIIVSYQSGIQ